MTSAAHDDAASAVLSGVTLDVLGLTKVAGPPDPVLDPEPDGRERPVPGRQ
jgi:hypothetical protein